MSATRVETTVSIAAAVQEARANQARLRSRAGEAAAYAFYLNQGRGAPSWWELSPEQKGVWVGNTPLSFFARLRGPRAGA